MKREWLVKIRKSKQLTQQQVADASFIDRTYYTHIESGTRTPSLSVAQNIAESLGFDPFVFFIFQLNSPIQTETEALPYPQTTKILRGFNSLESAEIVYLYNEEDYLIQNMITFILAGLKKGSLTLLFEKKETNRTVKSILESMISEYEFNERLFFYNSGEQSFNVSKMNPIESSEYPHPKENEPVHVWAHLDPAIHLNFLPNLFIQLDSEEKLKDKKYIYVRPFNATEISAALNIRLMIHYKYLMTDFEIVNSPLYKKSQESFTYPTDYTNE